MNIETRSDAVHAVMSGLQFLILSHASTSAREQYMPSPGVDQSDETIKENLEYMSKLRGLREMFENLVMGVILPTTLPKINPSSRDIETLQAWLTTDSARANYPTVWDALGRVVNALK